MIHSTHDSAVGRWRFINEQNGRVVLDRFFNTFVLNCCHVERDGAQSSFTSLHLRDYDDFQVL